MKNVELTRLYSDFANIGALMTGTLNTGIAFASGKNSTLGAITLPPGKWIVFARIDMTYNSDHRGTIVDFVLATDYGTSCAIYSPQTDHWERQTLVGYESMGNKIIPVVATAYGTLATDQVSCRQLYAVRLK